MNAATDQVTYLITHPQAMIYSVATLLLYPVLVLEVVLLVFVVFDSGRFVIEFIRRRNTRSRTRIHELAAEARMRLAEGKTPEALEQLRRIGRAGYVLVFMDRLQDTTDLHRMHLPKSLRDTEFEIDRSIIGAVAGVGLTANGWLH